MLDLIRASALHGYTDLVRELGADPAALLAEEHVRPDLLGDPENYIPFRTLGRIVDRTARELQCPGFSLKLAARQSIEILGPIALIARFSSTARSALAEISAHMSNYSPALQIGIEPGPGADEATYRFAVLVPNIPLEQVHQLGLGVSLGIFRLLMGSGFRPRQVLLPDGPPAGGGDHERFFGCPVRFGADFCGMQLAGSDLDRRLAADDPFVREYVARYLNTASPPADDLVASVRHLIDRTLPTGHANVTGIAAHLGVHTRTLHRWLAGHDATFEDLLDEVRRDNAARLLRHSSLPISHISATLGYSQQSCLSRSCARWFGMAPREVRRTSADPEPASATVK